jgi:c-di-GMP-binding flagellar brake protein YcgR
MAAAPDGPMMGTMREERRREEPDMIERRRRHRFVERNEVLIRTAVDRYQGAGTAAHTYDLSTGGARVVTSKSYPVGSMIKIRISLSGSDEVVALDGQVRWFRRRENEDVYEIGVEFERLTSQTILILIRHLYGRNEGIPSTVA